jgi:transcriptional regulator with XRE-family HTH domain
MRWAVILWEQDRSTPSIRYYPAIFQFLGYDPFPEPTTLPQRIAAKRRQLGLTIEGAALSIGVDEGTLRRWESGEWKPRMSTEAVQRFLDMRAPVPARSSS